MACRLHPRRTPPQKTTKNNNNNNNNTPGSKCICEGRAVAPDVGALNCFELRTKLQEQGLDTKGNKAELAKRLKAVRCAAAETAAGLGDIPGVPGGNGAARQCRRCLTTLAADAEIWVCSNFYFCSNSIVDDDFDDATADAQGEPPRCNLLCDPCYNDYVKYDESDDGNAIASATATVRRYFALPQPQKALFRSHRRDEGYLRSRKLGKESFSWRRSSAGLLENSAGEANALGRLSDTLLHLGADVVTNVFHRGIGIPKAVWSRNWAAGTPGLTSDFSQDAGETVMDEDALRTYDLWMSRGLIDPESSVLQAFEYFPSEADDAHVQCEPHVDRGLLTVVLNPHGLEFLDSGTGKWIDAAAEITSPNQAVVFAGITLERATNGIFKAATHRVVGDQDRLSIVMKLRADPTPGVTVLDVAWATKNAPDADTRFDGVAPVLLWELMAELGAAHGSINVQPLSERIADHYAMLSPKTAEVLPALSPPPTGAAGEFDRLPGETIAMILSLLGAEALGRLACVCKWFNSTATSDALWLRLCRAANMDWTEFKSARPGRCLHGLAGPQLVTFDRNEEITLYVTFDLNLSAHIGHPGARHAFEAATARTEALERSRGRQRNDPLLGRTRTIAVTTDQRSPLREVIPESFIDVINMEYGYHNPHNCYSGKAKQFEHGDHYGDGDDYDVGKRHHIDTSLSAWNYRLKTGDLLTMAERGRLMD